MGSKGMLKHNIKTVVIAFRKKETKIPYKSYIIYKQLQ